MAYGNKLDRINEITLLIIGKQWTHTVLIGLTVRQSDTGVGGRGFEGWGGGDKRR